MEPLIIFLKLSAFGRAITDLVEAIYDGFVAIWEGLRDSPYFTMFLAATWIIGVILLVLVLGELVG